MELGEHCAQEVIVPSRGGAGGCSDSGVAVVSPNRPSGSREASTDSSRLVGTATFLAARGPLLVGVLGEDVVGNDDS